MSKLVQVRNVPDDVHRLIKARAAAKGVSLSEYVRDSLQQAALGNIPGGPPEPEELIELLRAAL